MKKKTQKQKNLNPLTSTVKEKAKQETYKKNLAESQSK